MASLNARKVSFESAIKSGKKAEEMDRSEWWTADDGRALEEVERAKRGLLFFWDQVDPRIVHTDAMPSSGRVKRRSIGRRTVPNPLSHLDSIPIQA